jgi:hypothetical protein
MIGLRLGRAPTVAMLRIDRTGRCDLDGTLIDSSGGVQRSWRKLAERVGRPWPDVEPHIHGVPTTHFALDAPTVTSLDRIDFRSVDSGILVGIQG